MISMPPPELHDALMSAAAKHGLPVTLLAALAYDASAFDPKANRDGKRGLFGFTDALCKAFDVADPNNPAQAIEGACAALVGIVKYWSNFPAIFASWHFLTTQPHTNTNLTIIESAASKVAMLPGGSPPSWPAELRVYCSRLIAFRYYFSNRGNPKGAGVLEQLDNATTALAKANISNTPRIKGVMYNTAAEARKKLTDYKASKWPDPTLGSLWAVWLAYRDAFDVAPITNAETPLPELIEPNWYRERLKTDPFAPTMARTYKEIAAFVAAAERGIDATAAAVKAAAKEGAKELGERVDQLMIGGFVLAAGLGALYIIANAKRRT